MASKNEVLPEPFAPTKKFRSSERQTSAEEIFLKLSIRRSEKGNEFTAALALQHSVSLHHPRSGSAH